MLEKPGHMEPNGAQWSKLEQRLDLSQDDIGVTLSCSFHVKVLKFRSKLSDLYEVLS